MRVAFVWEDSIDASALSVAVRDRVLYGRSLTSTCKLYASGGTIMLTGPQSFALPRNWVDGGLVCIQLADSDEDAADNAGYSSLLAHEVQSA